MPSIGEMGSVLNNTMHSGGHKQIYADLMTQLAGADIAVLAASLGLVQNEAGEAEIPFCRAIYRVSPAGLRCRDGQSFSYAAGSALIRYLLQGSRIRPSGRFVTFAELAGPLFKHGSYSVSALEHPIVRRFSGRVPGLMAAAAAFGGKPGGEGGLGSVSLIFELVPRIPMQLIFYDRDEEFPARATLLFDSNATQLIDFETLAVLMTLFVHSLTGSGLADMSGKR